MKINSMLALASLLLFCARVEPAFAQSPSNKLEIGAQFTLLKITNDQTEQFALFRIDKALMGGGIRIGYSLTNNLTIEAEGNIFKREAETNFLGGSDSSGQRRSEGLFGAKYGKRTNRMGIFGKVRPGFVRFDSIGVFVRSPSTNIDIKNY